MKADELVTFNYTGDTKDITLLSKLSKKYKVEAIFNLTMRTNSNIYKNVHENVIDMEILDALKGE
jgi:hypothetical protein